VPGAAGLDASDIFLRALMRLVMNRAVMSRAVVRVFAAAEGCEATSLAGTPSERTAQMLARWFAGAHARLVARPVELRGADPKRHLAWAAAGFLCTMVRMGGAYVSMLLVMTFNVWIILGVLLGHAAGYVALAGVARRGSLPAEVRVVGQEESELEQQRELGSAPKREVTLLQEVTTGTCCAQNCECG
jgi:hypothetical protein